MTINLKIADEAANGISEKKVIVWANLSMSIAKIMQIGNLEELIDKKKDIEKKESEKKIQRQQHHKENEANQL